MHNSNIKYFKRCTNLLKKYDHTLNKERCIIYLKNNTYIPLTFGDYMELFYKLFNLQLTGVL